MVGGVARTWPSRWPSCARAGGGTALPVASVLISSFQNHLFIPPLLKIFHPNSYNSLKQTCRVIQVLHLIDWPPTELSTLRSRFWSSKFLSACTKLQRFSSTVLSMVIYPTLAPISVAQLYSI